MVFPFKKSISGIREDAGVGQSLWRPYSVHKKKRAASANATGQEIPDIRRFLK
jgi:hypothetical protein